MRIGSIPSFVSLLFASLTLLIGATTPVQAQTGAWGDLAISAVAVDYDLSGVGQTAGVAVRATRELTSHLVLEARGLYARPDQQFGASALFVPEAQLQYRWSAARFTPFVGGGAGLAAVRSDFDTFWDPTVSFAGGTGFRLTDQLGLLGELRVRGVEWRFTGSTAEWSLGLAWRLGSSR